MRLVSFLVGLLLCTSAGAADGGYLAELVARSRELRLAERPEWLKLGHYVPNVGGPGVHSLVDSPNFFNARQGKDDPRAELEGTLAAFFAPPDAKVSEQHPQCAFVARYGWLAEKLAFD